MASERLNKLKNFKSKNSKLEILIKSSENLNLKELK